MPEIVQIQDLKIFQGSRYLHEFTYKDLANNIIDITGYSGRMQIRAYKTSTVILYDSTTLGDIVINGPNGTVTLNIPTSVTTNFTFRRGVYDIEIIDPSGEVTRFVEGVVSNSLEVTR